MMTDRIRSNYHTHTRFCDGRDTPEEMVLAAIEKGFFSLGFSGHSYFVLDADITMDAHQQAQYRAEILRLREKYKDKIDLFLGIEQDSFTPFSPQGYDYVIASVHSVLKDGVFCQVDYSLERMQENLLRSWGGDMSAYEQDYFAEVCRLPEKIPEADIIGHIDLITKYDEKLGIRRSPEYFALATRAAMHLAKYGKLFEINTGAIGRGMRTTPYPSPEILSVIRREGGRIVITSDCHNKDFIDCGFDLAVALAKECGFKNHSVLTKEGWKEIPLP